MRLTLFGFGLALALAITLGTQSTISAQEPAAAPPRAMVAAGANNFAQYIAIQNHYNLLERKEYESDMAPALKDLGLSGIPFFALARGFLSGKYRKGATVESVRAGGVANYLNDAGYALLEKLDVLAKSHNASVSAIAIAWLRAQPTISAPIASARTVAQLNEIVPLVPLTSEELASLTN